jgi:integrase
MPRKRTGSIQVRANSIRLRFYFREERCEEVLYITDKPAAPTPANRKWAERLLAEITDKIRLGLFQFADYFPNSKRAAAQAVAVEPEKTFKDFALSWLKGKRAELKAESVAKYELRLAQFWYPHFGDKAIKTIKRSDINDAIAASGNWAERSAKRWNDALIPLRGTFQLAIDDQAIEHDPTAKFKNKTPNPEPAAPLSYSEVLTVLDHVRRHYHEQIYNALVTLFFTGMRPGELIAAAWPTMDLTTGVLRVVTRRLAGKEDSPKNGSQRDIKLVPRALAAIQSQRVFTQLRGDKVFEYPATGEPYHEYRALRENVWDPTLKVLGLRHRAFYNTRHTCATLALMAGVHPQKVARQIGNTPRMVYDTYGKWLEEDYDQETVAQLRREFAPWLSRSHGGEPIEKGQMG